MVPLIWNTAAGLDQDKVFKIVYTRARWVADTDVRRAYAATTRAAAMEDTAHPLRLTLIKRLRQKGPADCDRDCDELDLDWALQQYVDQEGACFYTGVTLTLSGPIYTTPFVLSFERRDESLGYTPVNTEFIAAEFNCGYERCAGGPRAGLLARPRVPSRRAACAGAQRGAQRGGECSKVAKREELSHAITARRGSAKPLVEYLLPAGPHTQAQKPASSSHPIHVFVVGNCPSHPDGLGNNMSKFVLASKAEGIWHGRHSGVYAHDVSVIDFSTA